MSCCVSRRGPAGVAPFWLKCGVLCFLLLYLGKPRFSCHTRVLRGPRPPAAKWPRASKPQPTGHAKLGPVQFISDKGPQFGGSVGSVGTRRFDHEGGGRGSSETCETGGCCYTGGSGHQSRRRARTSYLERALGAMEDIEGPEVSILRTALKRAQKDAQVLPVEVQIREREAFIERARKRIGGQVVRSAESGRSGEEVDRVEGTCTDTSAAGQFRSRSVAAHGFAITGSSRQLTGSSCSGQAKSKPQARVPQGGFCAPLRRGDARVDGVATEGLANGGYGWASRGSGKDLQSLGESSGRVAADHSSTGCCRQFRRRVGVAGSSWRGAICPILSVHSKAFSVVRGGADVRQSPTNRWVLRVNAKYGLRGVRIGEAGHPGPDSRRRRTRRLRAMRQSWDSDSPESPDVVRKSDSQGMDTDGEISLSRAPMSNADSPPLPLSSPPSEVVRALEADLCSHPHASRRVVLVSQSPDGTPRSVHDVVDLDPSVNGSVRWGSVLVSPILVEPSVQPLTVPASSGAVRDVHRGETIVDSSADEPLARRVPAVLEGSPARTHWDSDVQVSLGSSRLENEELEGRQYRCVPDSDGDDNLQAHTESGANRFRSRSPHTMEFDLSRFDSDEEPLSQLVQRRHDSIMSTQRASAVPTWQDEPGSGDGRNVAPRLGPREAGGVVVEVHPSRRSGFPERVAQVVVESRQEVEISSTDGGTRDDVDVAPPSLEDTESIDGVEESQMGDDVVVASTEEAELHMPQLRAPTLQAAFEALDHIQPCDHFRLRASVMKSVPKFLRGPFKNALKVALEAATRMPPHRAAVGSCS